MVKRKDIVLSTVPWLMAMVLVLFCATQSVVAQSAYLDETKPIELRITDLISRMTLEEKIGQINMPIIRPMVEEGMTEDEAIEQFIKGELVEGMGPGGGFFAYARRVKEGAREQATRINKWQRMAMESNRLKIPLLLIEEGTHGAMFPGATIYPEGPSIGSTWNMDLVEDIYTQAAREARGVGTHALNTIVIEPIRDPRLGRNEEAYSEDPYMCAEIAKAIVDGTQGDDLTAPDRVIASFCHFPGQAQPMSGLERGAMEISERTLRKVFLPPWVAGLREKGALSVMATYPAINDKPAHASEWINTTILREELGFEGIVLCEGGGIGTVIYEKVVHDMKEAGVVNLKAGVDVGIWWEEGYMGLLKESIEEGLVSMDLLDRAVRRVLRVKYRLGLFENPYVDVDRAVKVSHTAEHQQTALQTAREGIVLLKNEDNMLPLNKNVGSVAVIGPNADHEINQMGDYTVSDYTQDIVTVLDGIRAAVPSASVDYVKGCNVIGDEVNEIDQAIRAAEQAEVAVLVIGESTWGAGDTPPTDGEGYDVASLDLTGMQQDLVKAIYDTGTPTVVVLINGRPLSTRWIAENIPAVVEAWLPGEKGGTAVAEVLFGDYNPDGRMPITVPRHSGQLPSYYNYGPAKEYWINDGWGDAYVDMPATPLYHFGHGLSYTSFEYSNLQIGPDNPGPGTTMTISVDVQNTGDRRGGEVVQLYINDVISSMTTPVIELKGFEKIWLDPGENQTVTFTLTPDMFAMLDQSMEWVVEPGAFEVMVGHASNDIRLRGEFEVVKKM